MHSTIEKYVNASKNAEVSIALPEIQDPRVKKAAILLCQQASVKSVVVPSGSLSNDMADLKDQVGYSKLVEISSLNGSIKDEIFLFLKNKAEKKGKPFNEAKVRQYADTPLAQSAFLIRTGRVNACIAGAVFTTAEVVRAGLQLVGTAEGIKTVSGAFLMIGRNGEALYFADSGVVIDPSVEQLVDIAAASVKSWIRLNPSVPPKVAFLSFATLNSANHPLVEKTAKAKHDFSSRYPEIICEGPIQFDAAINATVAKRKCPDSGLQGDANIFIFPDLNAGNITYKAVQRLAGYEAFGPLLQGFAGGICDLSRGATTDDIVGSALLACLLSN